MYIEFFWSHLRDEITQYIGFCLILHFKIWRNRKCSLIITYTFTSIHDKNIFTLVLQCSNIYIFELQMAYWIQMSMLEDLHSSIHVYWQRSIILSLFFVLVLCLLICCCFLSFICLFVCLFVCLLVLFFWFVLIPLSLCVYYSNHIVATSTQFSILANPLPPFM